MTGMEPGRAEYEAWRAAVPAIVCNVPGGPWDELSPGVRAGFAAIAGAAPAGPWETVTKLTMQQAAVLTDLNGYIGRRAAGELDHVARELESLAGNYPESAFPADAESRDGVSGAAMRHAYLTALKLVRDHQAVLSGTAGLKGGTG